MLPHLHDAKDKIDKVGEGPIGFSPTFLVWLCFVCFRLIFAFVWLCNAFYKAWWDECPAYGHWVPKLRGKSAPSLGISASSMRLWSRKTRLLQMLLPKSWYFSPKTWCITDIFFCFFEKCQRFHVSVYQHFMKKFLAKMIQWYFSWEKLFMCVDACNDLYKLDWVVKV